MPLIRPSLPELRSRTAADMQSRLGIGPLQPRMVVKILSEIIAGAAHQLYGYIQYAAAQLFPDTAENEYMERWASLFGYGRIAATYAKGNVTFTGTPNTVVPAGTNIQRNDGAIFACDVEGVLSGGGSVTIAVTAALAGATSNTIGNTQLTMTNPIRGVSSTVTVSSGGINGGVEQESDTSLRSRLMNRLKDPPHGGSKSDYVNWAKSVAGVTRAWCYPLYLGAGTVGVTFVTDDAVGGPIPSSQDVDDVDAYIEARRPVTAEVKVFAPVALPINMNITLIPNNSSTKAAVTAELVAMLRRESQPGGTIYISKIREAISIAPGENNHVLNSPTVDIVADTGELPILGTITWS